MDRPTLYVSDLDGTLLGSDATISAATLEMLNAAIERGLCFTIATARTPATVAEIIKNLNLKLPAIVMTGAALWDKETEKYSDVKYMSEKGVIELLDIYRKKGCSTFYMGLKENLLYIYHTGELSKIENEFIEARRHSRFKKICVPADGNSELPVPADDIVLFYGMQPEDLSEATYQATKEVEGVRVQKYHDFYGPEIGILEAFSPASTKAAAIESLARKIGAGRIVVFGDNINDIPMMRIADVGVAMANGVEETKREADIVIGLNTEDSVAKYILKDAGMDSLIKGE